MRSAAVVAFAVALAFAVRVVPAYHDVLTPAGVNFQDDDSWFHMRSIHNLAAHFPRQSGFDPYALFPGGQALYTEPWDLTVASVAWALGAGKPDSRLVDLAGAWLPPFLGALLPIPVFFLGRRLFGELAAQLSAIAVAVIPGTLLWETHLGVPDHHVAECLLSLLALASLCSAADRSGSERKRLIMVAGVLLGLYLMVRPAGIFLPASFGIAAVLEPLLAPLAIGALSLASVVFLASSGNKWVHYTWASLAGSIAVCGLAWMLGGVWNRKRWPRMALPAGVGMCALLAGCAAAAIRPASFFTMVSNLDRFLPGGHDVFVNTIAELGPIWKAPPLGVAAIFENLGGLWPIALAFIFCSLPNVWRVRRPALTLFSVWAVLMTVGGFIQLRMVLYFAPVLCLAAGGAAAWAIGKMRGRAERFRAITVAAFVVLAMASSLPAAYRLTSGNGGLDADWRSALNWIAQNTPDPMGDASAWSRFWPRLNGGEFPFPGSAYGVLTLWEYGDQVNAVAHRIPNANGTQVHADSVASFLTDIDPDRARVRLAKLRTRYIMLDPMLLTRDWPAIVLWASGDGARYRARIFRANPGGRAATQITVYLPDFYRTMAARLYVFDGKASSTRFRISVFTLSRERALSGEEYDFLLSERKFDSEQKAWNYMAVNVGERMLLGSTDPTVSCVEFGDVPWVRRVFTSDETPLREDRAPKAVKIFQVQ